MKYNISDIAKLSGVSKATVSRIINNKPNGFGKETKERVEKIIKELNYRPNELARSVGRSSSKMIGLIIPNISNQLYPPLVRGVDDYISQKGYTMLLCNSDSNPEIEQKHLLSFIDKRTDGIIICSGVSNEKFLKQYSKYNTPFVLIGRSFDKDYSDASITGDNEAASSMAVEFLIKNGNRNIAYLDGDPKVSGSIQKLKGYKQILFENGIQYNEEIVKNGDFSIEFGYKSVTNFLNSKTNFSAIFAGSDLIAIGAIKALKFNGIRVPEDVEVIGCDGIELSEIYEPNISTVSKPHYEMAQEASKMLIEIIEGKTSCMRHLTIKPTLVLRDTTKLI